MDNLLCLFTPTRTLPTIKTGIVGAVPMTIAPVENSMSVIIIVGFLPHLSERGPPNKEPIAAPKIAKETIVYKILILKLYFIILLSMHL